MKNAKQEVFKNRRYPYSFLFGNVLNRKHTCTALKSRLKMAIRVPDFLIIGSSKCGTTTLAATLARHSECCMSRPKEPEFFNIDANFLQGLEWYSKCWSHCIGEAKAGEATPRYTRRDLWPDVPKRIKKISPGIKLIHISRHPYEKLVSFWRMSARMVNLGMKQSLDAFFETDSRMPEIINSCRYEYQLEPYFKMFPSESFHLMTLEDLRDNPIASLENMFRFLKIDHTQAVKLAGIKTNTANLNTGFFARACSKLRRRQPNQFVERQELANSNYRLFEDRVRPDAEAHLARLGKPKSFWQWRSCDYS